MKRIFAFIAVIAILLSFTSCQLFFTNTKHTHTPIQYRAKASTCLEQGNLEYYVCSDCGKVFSDFRCTQEAKVEDFILEIGDHDWVGAKCNQPKTCAVCSLTEGEALGHNYADPDCENASKCLRCGDTQGEALGHQYDDDCDPDCNREGCEHVRDAGHVDADGDFVCDECGDDIVPDDDVDLPLDDFT